MSDRIVRKFLPKQIAFLRSEAPNVLYSGSVRAGKTYALCTKAVMRACTPGAREALCRKHRVTLTATTLVTLLRGDGLLPPVLPPGTYTINKAEGLIQLNGGGEIVYFGLDDPDKIGSRSLTGAALDEAVDFDERDWDMLQTRVSLDVPGVPRQVYGACNPGVPGHFLARRFGLALGAQALPGHVAFRTRSHENVFLPPDYLARIDMLTGVARKRLVLGEWVGSEGLIYDTWQREAHVRERPGPWARTIIAVDDGNTHPCAMLLIGVDGDGRMHVIREVHRSKMLTSAKVAAALDLARGHDIEAVVHDPSAAQLAMELADRDLPVTPADNTVSAGIALVQERLAPGPDGTPRLTVDPSCVELIREFESYEWDTTGAGAAKERPKKENDDGLDCLRYGTMHLRVAGLQVW